MSHGSYGKARHVSTKFSDLLAERLDERRELHDTGVQTEPLPFFTTAAQSWSTSSDENSNGNNSIAANEPLVAESIPHVTTEKTLMTLDVVSISYGKHADNRAMILIHLYNVDRHCFYSQELSGHVIRSEVPKLDDIHDEDHSRKFGCRLRRYCCAR